MIQWATENNCKWNEDTCKYAALNGHLSCLQWGRENHCDWNKQSCQYADSKRPFHLPPMGQREWLPLKNNDLSCCCCCCCCCCCKWPSHNPSIWETKWLWLEHSYLSVCSCWWPSLLPPMGEREQLSLEHNKLSCCCWLSNGLERTADTIRSILISMRWSVCCSKLPSFLPSMG